MRTSCQPSCKLNPPHTHIPHILMAPGPNIASLLKGSCKDIDVLALHPGVIFPACLWSPLISSFSSADLNASRRITHTWGAWYSIQKQMFSQLYRCIFNNSTLLSSSVRLDLRTRANHPTNRAKIWARFWIKESIVFTNIIARNKTAGGLKKWELHKNL